jgi:UDP-glucose 4-epimerase
MKILVTGGAGFIGSHLVDKLINEGNEVVVVDDISGGSHTNINNEANFYEVDCRNKELMSGIILHEKPEIIYHLAANAAENKAQFSPIDITSRNYSAFINTLTPFIKYGGRRFIFTSSIAVYGALQTPFKETDKPEPEDLYGVTKLAAERTLEIMSEVHGFEYVIARPHNVYGPRQNMSDPYRNVVTIWMNALLQGKPYYIYGDGEQRRCFSYIDDVIEGLYRCMTENVWRMKFNIGADKDYSINELNEAILKASESSVKAVFLDERPQEVKLAISDHTEAKKWLLYQDRTPLDIGIKKTWDWVKSVGYKEPKYTELELDNSKVPLNWQVQL